MSLPLASAEPSSEDDAVEATAATAGCRAPSCSTIIKVASLGGKATLGSIIMLEGARTRLNREICKRAVAWVHAQPSIVRRWHATYWMRYRWIIFSTLHLLISLLIWSHFFLKKFEQKEGVPTTVPAEKAVLPEEAGLPMPYYWAKRLVPPLEFGLMHAILFQFAVLPITMSRHLLTLASQTPLAAFIPFEHMVSFHIYVGYIACAFIALATIVFVVFFGSACFDHLHGSPHEPEDFCAKLTSEIMITGYVLFGCICIVLASSAFRRYIKYEVFYALHHLVFAIFVIAILHTLDDQFRQRTPVGKARSQNFHFLTTSMAIYVVDRLWTRMCKGRCCVMKFSVTGDRAHLLLKLRRPSWFSHLAGQYAYLQVPDVDPTWHPFSIASAPHDESFDFYMNVFEGQWTGGLVDLLIARSRTGQLGEVAINVMGPFGSCIQGGESYQHMMLICTASGMAPALSFISRRYERLLSLSDHLITKATSAAAAEPVLDSLDLRVRTLQYTWRLRAMQKSGKLDFLQSRPRPRMYAHACFDVIAHLFVAVDICQAFWSVSWAIIDQEGHAVEYAQWTALEVMSGIVIAFFVIHRVYAAVNRSFQPTNILSIIDAVAVGAMVCVHIGWISEAESAYVKVTYLQLILRSIFAAWRVFRIAGWSYALRNATTYESNQEVQTLLENQSFESIWLTRSASSCTLVLAELEPMVTCIDKLVGRHRLKHIFGFAIYVTHATREEQDALESIVRNTVFEGLVHFSQPDVKSMIMDRMQSIAAPCLHNAACPLSRSVVSFCGSPVVGALVRESVAEANIVAATLKLPNCHMDFREEYYGVLARGPKKAAKAAPSQAEAASPALPAQARLTFFEARNRSASAAAAAVPARVAPERHAAGSPGTALIARRCMTARPAGDAGRDGGGPRSTPADCTLLSVMPAGPKKVWT